MQNSVPQNEIEPVQQDAIHDRRLIMPQNEIEPVQQDAIHDQSIIVISEGEFGLDEAYSPTLPCLDRFSLSNNYADELPSCSRYCLNSKPPKENNFVGESVAVDWQNLKEQIDKFEQEENQVMPIVVANKKNKVGTLAKLLTEELEDVSDYIFIEAKWKIIDILKEASTKDRLRKAQMQNNRSSTPSSTSSSSVIIVRSPIPQEFNSSTPQQEPKPSRSEEANVYDELPSVSGLQKKK